MHPKKILLGAALWALAFDAAASCGAAFCVVNTDSSALGAWSEEGVRFDLKYEQVDLDQPRAGRDRVAVGAISAHHDEVETRNRNWIATLDASFGPRWGVAVALPFVDRGHFHIHNHRGEPLDERWNFSEVGDVRVLGRYQLGADATPEAPRSWGFNFGAKLPTGKHDVANAEGALAERSLQPGSGTTDAMLGAWWHGAAPLSGWAWFTRALAVVPVNTRDNFKPGRSLQLDGGVRYAVGNTVGLMVQANLLVKGRDSGSEAEPADSGQRALFVSPGISWNVTRAAQLYAFLQLPVYQYVNGLQLTADRAAVAGVSWRF